MSEERIDIVIDENGEIEIKTSGIKGKKCIDEVKNIIGEISEAKIIKQDEYYQEEKLNKKVTVRSGK